MKIRTKITLLISALVLVSLSLVLFQYLLEKDRIWIIIASLVLMIFLIYFFLSLLRDITEQENLDRSKRDFISLVSHELRTPLTSLGWAIEKIESVANIPESISKTTIPYMKSSLTRIKTLTATIVDVSKIENGSIIAVNTDIEVSKLVAHSIEDVKSISEIKKITVLVNDETNGNDKVKSDERLLQIIISNIISNAFQYSNDGGQVQIVIKKEGQELLVNVLNTGQGIPKEEQDKIFTKMFRATNAGLLSPDGAGLGLYISKSFLERLGGSITFVSTSGKDTVFTIHLPLNS